MSDSHTQPPRQTTDVFRERLESRLAELCREREAQAAALSPDAGRMVGMVRTLCSGGKRVRALLAFNAFVANGGDPLDDTILELGAAIELFQAAALIHDDIIDRSDTRRGAPSVHRAFGALHAEAGWGLDGSHFGESAAILTGDLALAMADEAFARLDARHGSPLRQRFDTMKWEVMAGQYLDIVEEVAAPTVAPADAAHRALTVLRFKSAKYTFEHPTALGALLAGASAETERAFADFALPIGEAFQLVDDDLGVFGDPDVTGKPAGDDLREGKRTLLVALAIERADDDARRVLTDTLGHREATDEQILACRRILEETGARDEALSQARSFAQDGLSLLTPIAHCTLGQATPEETAQRQDALDALRALAETAVARRH